jgi:hypothetical protein
MYVDVRWPHDRGYLSIAIKWQRSTRQFNTSNREAAGVASPSNVPNAGTPRQP